jgi:hypothetical protein
VKPVTWECRRAAAGVLPDPGNPAKLIKPRPAECAIGWWVLVKDGGRAAPTHHKHFPSLRVDTTISRPTS